MYDFDFAADTDYYVPHDRSCRLDINPGTAHDFDHYHHDDASRSAAVLRLSPACTGRYRRCGYGQRWRQLLPHERGKGDLPPIWLPDLDRHHDLRCAYLTQAAARNVGMVLGIGLAGAIFTTHLAENAFQSFYRGIDMGFLAAAGVAAFGIIMSAIKEK